MVGLAKSNRLAVFAVAMDRMSRKDLTLDLEEATWSEVRTHYSRTRDSVQTALVPEAIPHFWLNIALPPRCRGSKIQKNLKALITTIYSVKQK